MARGTDFGGIHSHRDLNLIQQQVNEQPAEPKLNMIDIPGADGSKDLSELPGGRLTYKDRTVSWLFALYPGDNWDTKHRQVSNALNGKRCRITLDTNPAYYYLGRLIVKKYNKDKALRQITVEAVCSPYLLKQEPTVLVLPISVSTLVWDGNTDGVLTVNGIDNRFCHMSSHVPPVETFTNGGSYTWVNQLGGDVKNTVDFSTVTVEKDCYYTSVTFFGGIVVAPKDNAEFFDVVLPKKGIYFMGTPVSYVESLTFNNPVSEPQTVDLVNDRKTVSPQIVCTDNNTEIIFGNTTVKLNAGTHQLLDFQLTAGSNPVTVSGSGTVTFTYQEGSL